MIVIRRSLLCVLIALSLVITFMLTGRNVVAGATSVTAQGIENSLDTKLQNVLSAVNAAKSGNAGSVCGQLGAFINETTAQSGKKLTVAQATQLIAAARQIQAVIGCQ